MYRTHKKESDREFMFKRLKAEEEREEAKEEICMSKLLWCL
jgi:hypothetical protein